MEKLSERDSLISKFDPRTEPDIPACVDCYYWEIRDGVPGDGYGFCRRHAPLAATVAKAAEYMARWPLTDSSEWCGEHRLRVRKSATQTGSTTAG